MNPKVKAKWLKALRSGEYDQTRGKLLRRTSSGDRFCCLGVLCNLYAQEHPGTGFRKENLSFFGRTYDIPSEVADWAMLTDVPKSYTYLPAELHLSYMNDDEEKNFNQIADWIKENL